MLTHEALGGVLDGGPLAPHAAHTSRTRPKTLSKISLLGTPV
jgi:hypothetical protein